MTFRNDHDAALARAEALDQELERSKDKLEDSQEEIERLRAHNAALAAQNAKLRAASEPGVAQAKARGFVPVVPPTSRPAPSLPPVLAFDERADRESQPRAVAGAAVALVMALVIAGGLALAVYVVVHGHFK